RCHAWRAHEETVTALSFTRDGGRLVIGCAAGVVLVWDLARVAGLTPGQVERGDAAELWKMLGGSPREAWQGELWLRQADATLLHQVAERLPSLCPEDRESIQRRIAQLDAEQYADRKEAEQTLAARRHEAEPALRAALRAAPSLDKARRI